MQWQEADWLGFVVRFICGAIFGIVVVGVTFYWDEGYQHPLWWFAGAAIAIGLASGFFGDEFWELVADWFGGWW